jgi:hypothetical protein
VEWTAVSVGDTFVKRMHVQVALGSIVLKVKNKNTVLHVKLDTANISLKGISSIVPIVVVFFHAPD